MALLALLLFAALVALGTWQVERRAWKHALIAQVDARIHARPVPAPGPAAWRGITSESDAYRRVTARGTFLNDRETFVQASTALGSGYWVMTPLRATEGFTVLVNRGFVPPDRRRDHNRIAGAVTVTGLLRITEPKGGFLRSNDAGADRWYSRDVAAIGAKRGLRDVAPYFIDADASDKGDRSPMGGLTVVSFPDNHLAYALTWYGLALMVLGGAFIVGREEWRIRARASKPAA
ncbi:MAG: SURF1 family protein [Sphingobium sp.]